MEQLPQVGFMKSFVLFWKNYVNFKGRSRRSEYWYMALWHLILMVPAVCANNKPISSLYFYSGR
ncbi:hypothetical protein W209_02270 [Staphylococcus aureus DAR1082]|nr:hypothetical protein MQG_00076 [Staphylococcus aureus subsp. aureus VRS4]ENJ78485.1 hypothetical protein UGW_02337 [Staphylococcus aureus M0351]EUO08071.1 hypothetical protein P079_00091 [Staphylococcus aureus M1008]EUY37392.1 hypothetical protein O498_00606 [Staphylococcus aureus M0399]EVD84400.1 hypothetical protein T747_00174 [Staphylococcus aureus UCIM6053]EVH40742.1 hypothetical protein T929_00954 [Staphylococcus aureus SMMC6108]EYN02515.1 hypothetical protein W130_01839 [Staphylococc